MASFDQVPFKSEVEAVDIIELITVIHDQVLGKSLPISPATSIH